MKTIDITKTEITLLRNSEHGLASKAVNEAYAAKLPAAGDAILTAYHQKFNTKVLTEEAMLKSIWASEHTPRMEYFHHERGLAMSTVCRLVDSAAEATFEPARKEAGLKLRPIVHAYKGLTSETRAGETDDIFNILEDLNTPENAAALATLSLTPFITRAATLNQEYYDLLGEREQEWQHTHHGTLLPIRRETDTVLFDLTDATNLHYKIAPSPALEALVDAVNAALQPFKRIVARRHKHSSSSSPGGGDNSGGGDDEGTDEGIQKPENTPPPASNTPQNPTDEPHHLDPNEHPAAGE